VVTPLRQRAVGRGGRQEERVNLLGLLPENVGVDKAVRLGDPRVRRETVDGLGEPRA
jgi:hypothetical protein